MKKGALAALVASAGLLVGSSAAFACEAFNGPPGPLTKKAGTCDGYTLVAPQMATVGNFSIPWAPGARCTPPPASTAT